MTAAQITAEIFQKGSGRLKLLCPTNVRGIMPKSASDGSSLNCDLSAVKTEEKV